MFVKILTLHAPQGLYFLMERQAETGSEEEADFALEHTLFNLIDDLIFPSICDIYVYILILGFRELWGLTAALIG